jgi:hypothetical protein
MCYANGQHLLSIKLGIWDWVPLLKIYYVYNPKIKTSHSLYPKGKFFPLLSEERDIPEDKVRLLEKPTVRM